jgi:hypothetical protein
MADSPIYAPSSPGYYPELQGASQVIPGIPMPDEFGGTPPGPFTPAGTPPGGPRTPAGTPPGGPRTPLAPPEQEEVEEGSGADVKDISETKLHGPNPFTTLSRKLLKTYFQTVDYPFTRHHIDSFDQFISQDIPAIIRASNPLLVMKNDPEVKEASSYKYKTEIFIGGEEGTEIEIGSPTLSLQRATEVRLLFPNEARLRNLTYASTVYANVFVRVTIATAPGAEPIEPLTKVFTRMPLFKIPILLHSRYCLLHGKPVSFLKEAG